MRIIVSVIAALLCAAGGGDAKGELLKNVAALDAAARNDKKAALTFYEEQAIFANDKGQVWRKADYVGEWMNESIRYDDVNSAPSVRVFGEVRAESSVWEATGKGNGKPFHADRMTAK